MIEALLIVLSLLLTAACGVFVAAEFSLTTVERSRVEQAAREGDQRAKGVLAAVRRLTFQLSAAQLGITVTSLVIGMLAEPALARLLRGPLEAAGLSGNAAETAALVVGLVLSTGVLMVVGELVPKNLAIAQPLRVAEAVSPSLRVFARTFSLLIGHLNRAANRVVRRLGLEPTEELASARTPDELAALARHSAEEGTLELDTAQAFVRALHLRDLHAQAVMTPRIDIKALPEEASAADVTRLTAETGLSRFPVYRGSLDDVVGVVHVKAALALPAGERAAVPVSALQTEPLLVPETLAADVLLELLHGQNAMAVVGDEYGGTKGLVTLEDVLEEIVGEIRDEHDAEQFGEVRSLAADADGRPRWRADGTARVHRLRALGLRVPPGPYETVAGLIAAGLGRIPEVGDTYSVRGWTLRVDEVAHHTAHLVEITAPPAESDGETGGSR